MAEGIRRAARQLAAATDSVRWRLTAAAVLVLAVALIGGAFAFVFSLERVIEREVTEAARRDATELAAAVAAGNDEAALAVYAGDEVFAQVIGEDNSVLAASTNVTGMAAAAALDGGHSRRITAPLDDDVFVAVAVTVPSGADGEARTVIVARTLDPAGEASAAAVPLLAVGIPLVLLIVGGVTWMLVGRTLAPVEAMRRQVETIGASALHRRVPRPRTHDEIGPPRHDDERHA